MFWKLILAEKILFFRNKKKQTKKLKKTKQKNVTIFSQVFKIQKDLGSKSILRDKFWI